MCARLGVKMRAFLTKDVKVNEILSGLKCVFFVIYVRVICTCTLRGNMSGILIRIFTAGVHL